MTSLITSASVDMKIDDNGIPLVEEKDIIELMYQGRAMGELFTDDSDLVASVMRSAQDLSLPLPFRLRIHQFKSVEEMTDSWHMPEAYETLDIEYWFADRITTAEQAERVADELSLYKEGGLYPLLRFLIYMVDIMRENRIVWGVGRGSSVASYCLYLIGIHKIDSMKFDLDIREFLK